MASSRTLCNDPSRLDDFSAQIARRDEFFFALSCPTARLGATAPVHPHRKGILFSVIRYFLAATNFTAILLLALFLRPPISHAAQEISLADAIAIARQHNPDLAAASQEINVARGELEQANDLSQSPLLSDNAANYRARQNRSNSQDWRVGMMQEFEIFGQRSLRQKSRTL